MIGYRVVVYWEESGYELGEFYLDGNGLLAARSFYPELEDEFYDVLGEVLQEVGLPYTEDLTGYAYQSGGQGYLEEVAYEVDCWSISGFAVVGYVQELQWCPYTPKGIGKVEPRLKTSGEAV